MTAATVVPTNDNTVLGSGIHVPKDLSLAIENDIEQVETCEGASCG